MKPLGRVALVSLNRAMVWVNTRELDIFAEIVPSVDAQETFAAGHARLDRDAVARLQVLDTLADADDNACCLVADDAVSLEYKRSDATRFPEVDVRPVERFKSQLLPSGFFCN